jgi:hypothetical protein
MNRDEIIRMADEAGITPWERLEYIGGKRFSSTDEGLDGDLTCLIQFANLVAAAEREACAKVCEKDATAWGYDSNGASCAIAIRARGKA